MGYTVQPGEPYYFSGPTQQHPAGGACTSNNPQRDASFRTPPFRQPLGSRPGTNLLQYIPAPNNRNGTFSTSAFNQTLRDDKGAYRLDANTRFGLFSAYYFLDDWSQNNPYPVAQGGANVPGFNALYTGRAQLLDLGDTKTLGTSAVNEFHFSYLRNAADLGKPVGGVGVSLASQGFEVGPGTPGIVPLSPKTEGVESVGFNSYTIGTNTNELNQVGQHIPMARQFLQGDRNAHTQIRRRISLRSGQRQSPSRNSMAASSSSAPRPDTTSPIFCSAFPANTTRASCSLSTAATNTSAFTRRIAGASIAA